MTAKDMHDIKWIRDNPDAFDRGLARRGLPGEAKRLIEIDERRRAAIQKAEAALARRNAASREIGAAKKSNEEAAAQALMAEVARLKAEIPRLEEDAKKASTELEDKLAEIPNMPLDEVPDGKSAEDNVEHHRFGAKRNYGFTPQQHFDLGEALGQMDFETAAKLSGARFVVLTSGLARLERALGQFMLDVHTTEHGYTEVAPPLLVRDEVMFGTAQLPKFEDDQFETSTGSKPQKYFAEAIGGIISAFENAKEISTARLQEEVARGADTATQDLKNTSLWLIPTAEGPLTNLVRESILDESALPLRFTPCPPAFLAVAPAAGKDTRGMIRPQQVSKVELVSLTTPGESTHAHQGMLACAAGVL